MGRNGGSNMFFIGTYNYNLDDKNRLTMPSKLREQLGAKVYVTLGLDKCLAIYPVETFEKIEEVSKGTLIAVAVKVGKTRLIDNIIL